jgi:exonuclease III
MGLLMYFCRHREIDILILQEVAHEEFAVCAGYIAHINVATDRRGTGILMRQQLTLDRIDALPSGRGIAGYYKDTYFVNIYGPADAGRRAEREDIYDRLTVFI